MRPVLQALVLADQVYVDKRTGKKIIAGTFNRLWAQGLPAKLGKFTYAYICLTDVQGSLDIHLKYVDLKTNEVLLESPTVNVVSEDRLASTEMIVEVPQFPMPREGFYAFEVYAGKDMLGSLRIQVSLRSKEN